MCQAGDGRRLFDSSVILMNYFACLSQNMDPTQQAASQIIKGGTVTALTVSIKFCHAMLLSALRDNKLPYICKRQGQKLARFYTYASEVSRLIQYCNEAVFVSH